VASPIVHFEIGCRDMEKTRAFFTKLLDWWMTPSGGPAAVIDTGRHDGSHYIALATSRTRYTFLR